MPSVSFQRGVAPDASYASTKDTRIYSTNPATIYHSTTDLNAAPNHSTYGDGRFLIAFDVSAIPSSAVVSAASLELYLAQLVSGSGLAALEVWSLTQSWVETEACWQNRQSGVAWTAPGGTKGSLLGTINGTSTGTKTLSSAALAEAVQGWVSDPASNGGLLIKCPDADEASTPYTNMMFRPGEYTNAAQRPKLTVTYSVAIGTPSLALVSRTNTSLTLAVTHGAEGQYPRVGTKLYFESDPSTPIADCLLAESEVTLTGLNPATNYHLFAKTYDNQDPQGWSAASAVLSTSTLGASARPDMVCEVWDTLDHWEGSGLTASGNKVFAAADGQAGEGEMPVTGGSVFRLDAALTVSKSGSLWAGMVLKDETGAEKTVCVGYSMASGGLGLYDGADWISLLSAASIAAGQVFHIQLIADGSRISATAFHANGLNEYHASMPLPVGYTVDALKVHSERQADTLASLGYRQGLGPFADPTFDHLMVVSLACPENHPIRFRLPATYRSGEANHKTCLLCHASGQYLWTFWETTEPPRKQLHDALLADGWVLMLPEAHTRHWGHDEMLQDVALAHEYGVSVLGCERSMGVFASSMGGLMAWLTAAEHPAWFRGIAAVYPVCDLADMYDGGIRGGENFQAYINAAYSISASSSEDPAYQEATAGHNPLDRAGDLRRVPIRIWHGTNDATVPLAANSEAFAAAVQGAGGDITLTQVAGAGHGALGAACWDSAAVLSFLNACRAKGWASRLDRVLVRRRRR
ncbi:MAG: DNRLRE domain-containing protein [Armatimonadetes bacterium]|nr:DNRLRE domain-containing protein [Armatimonadota bacterium]